MHASAVNPPADQPLPRIRTPRLQRNLAFAVIMLTALVAFELFNYSTTDYALGEIEPTTFRFGDGRSAKLSYWPVWPARRPAFTHPGYFVSRCMVCLRQRGQNFSSSMRPGSLRRFFSVV